MVISERRKLLFIHIPKTGGSTVRQLLIQAVPDAKVCEKYHNDIHFAEAALGPSLADYYVFTFVRNPWERLVSWYSMMNQTPYGLPERRQAMLNVPFGTVIRESIGRNPHPFFTKTQLDYLVGANGERLVENIFRFEQFENECRRLIDLIGLGRPRIPHVNGTEHPHYSTYYDAETRQIVAERFADDIEEFGYTFEAV